MGPGVVASTIMVAEPKQLEELPVGINPADLGLVDSDPPPQKWDAEQDEVMVYLKVPDRF